MKGEIGVVIKTILDNPGKKWTPERVKDALPWLSISSETIGHNLRRARAKGSIAVSYYTSYRGQQVAEYSAPGPQDGPKQANNGPTLYFCSIIGSILPSPYFHSMLEVLTYCDRNFIKPLNIWTGSHEKPVLVEGGE